VRCSRAARLAAPVVVAVAAAVLLGCRPLRPATTSQTPARAASRTVSPSSTIPVPLDDASSLAALEDGRWAVSAGKTLAAVSPKGLVTLCTFGSRITCLAARGTVVYAGLDDHIEILTVRGDQVTSSSSSPSLGADALLVAVAPCGDGYCVSDATTATVFVFRVDGLLVGTIGKESFLLPSPNLDLAPAGTTEVWIAHAGRHRVERWSLDGSLERSWGAYAAAGDGFAGCCNPAHIASLPDGRIVTAEKGVWRVRVYDASGALRATLIPEGGLPAGRTVVDVAASAEGRIAVLLTKPVTIALFEPGTEEVTP
jgi:hypothetical protein